MINLVDPPSDEEKKEDYVNPYAKSEQKLELGLRSLVDEIRRDTLQSYSKKLYAAMNIWLTLGLLFPDQIKATAYMSMSKATALLINKEHLNEEELKRYEIAINFEPPNPPPPE